jgi:phage terminase large subunit-like protein
VTRGGTRDNRANLPARFIADVEREFGGTLLARQELDGELLEDLPGALWTRALIERCRDGAVPAMRGWWWRRSARPARRAMPAGSWSAGWAKTDRARARRCNGRAGQPRTVGRCRAETARAWGADRVVAEANQGGAMVGAVLRAANATLPLRLVHASRARWRAPSRSPRSTKPGACAMPGCSPGWRTSCAG